MNRAIGFSTGALAYGDFRKALAMLHPHAVSAIELSALRQPELEPLAEAVPSLDLSKYSYIAVHAPSRIEAADETCVVARLLKLAAMGWPIVIHPDAIHDYAHWRQFGRLLLVENMDKRKPVARTVDELDIVFAELPEAGFCLDLGHARQVDATMTEAYRMIRAYSAKLTQLHVSEVNTSSRHDSLSDSSVFAFRRIAEYLPEGVPVIVESVIEEAAIESELRRIEEALPVGTAA